MLKNLITDADSERSFRTRLLNTLASGAGLIHVRSSEVMRTLASIRRNIILEGHEYNEWDICNGTCPYSTEDLHTLNKDGDKNPQIPVLLDTIWAKHIWWIKEASDSQRDSYYVYVITQAASMVNNNPYATQRFLELNNGLPESTVRVIMLTEDIPLPESCASNFITLDFDRPGHGELLHRLETNLHDYATPESLDVEEEDYERIAVAASGMTIGEFDFAVSSAIVNKLYEESEGDESPVVTTKDLIEGVHMGKTEAIKKNDILELLHVGEMNEVGGMHNAKKWVEMRSYTYTPEFLKFGGQPPKGMVSVGVPGTGKSLLAKAVASEFGIPCVRMDFGSIFNALIGSSEERIRKALKLTEAMSPCVLFVDEIDKALGGLGGSGDSGTSMRVFGTFLTWLQEHKSPVFTIVTANNVTGLPPELLRRGRFDAIFATVLPNQYEREDVLAIHLQKRGHSIEDFSDYEIAVFLKQTDKFVPAEIEAIVQDGLVLAFNRAVADEQEPELLMDDLLEAIAAVVPLSKSHKSAIQAMVTWAEDNAMPASLSEKQYEELRGAPKGTKPRGQAKARPRRKTTRTSNITSIKRTRKKEEE